MENVSKAERAATHPETSGSVRAGSFRISAKAVNAVVIVVCAAALVPMLVIGIYDRPAADDFAYSQLVREVFLDSGFNPVAFIAAAAQTSANYYASWQGLYSSAFLMALQPGVLGSQFYCLGAWSIIVFSYVACVYLAYCIERHALRARAGLWPAAGFLLATLLVQCMPYANEGIYWFNGAVNYTPYFFATLVDIGLCTTALSVGKRWQRALAVVCAMLISLFVSGGNYLLAFFNVMAMAAFAVIGVAKRRWEVALPLVAAVVGFAASALAPGTAIRQETLNALYAQPGVVSTVVHSAYRVLMDLRLFVDLPVIVFLVVTTPLLLVWARRANVGFSGKVFLLACACAFLIMLGTTCVPFYAMGGFGEGRTRDATYLIDLSLVVGLYGYAVCLFASRLSASGVDTDRLLGKFGPVALAVCTVVAVGVVAFYGSSIAGHGNSAIAARSLMTGEAAQYAREYDEREAVLLESEDGTATITTLSTRPKLLFFSDIVRNGDDWSDDMALYYGLDKVTAVIPDGFDSVSTDYQ